MLTEPNDLVLDIFAGSNTTGQVSETERRRWLSFELSREYVATSAFRFMTKANTPQQMAEVYGRVTDGVFVHLDDYKDQWSLPIAV